MGFFGFTSADTISSTHFLHSSEFYYKRVVINDCNTVSYFSKILLTKKYQLNIKLCHGFRRLSLYKWEIAEILGEFSIAYDKCAFQQYRPRSQHRTSKNAGPRLFYNSFSHSFDVFLRQCRTLEKLGGFHLTLESLSLRCKNHLVRGNGPFSVQLSANQNNWTYCIIIRIRGYLECGHFLC